MATIQLANGKGVALIDDEDVGRIPLTGWCLHSMGYAARSHHRGKPSLLHRLVMDVATGMRLDHVNHNKLDCRKSNLRLANSSQNGQNRTGAQPNNRLGIRGVSWQMKPSGTIVFFARVQVNGRQIYKCGFRTAKEAETAAISLRRQHFTHSQECA